MNDFLLDGNGDLKISETGDLILTESIRQAVLIRLRWIQEEWRLGPDFGFPYFEEFMGKDPNLDFLSNLIEREAKSVEGVVSARVTSAKLDAGNRRATFEFVFATDDETFREEVALIV